MRFTIRLLDSAPVAGRLFAGLALAVALLGAVPAPAQTSPVTGAPYISLDHLPAAQMAPADAALLRKRHRELATEAAFFGYNFDTTGWTIDQTLCPDIPDALLLHARRRFHDGAESLFTALVPRGPARVWVVPVLYRNATPFHAAIGSERSMTVFNRAVPASIAAHALDPQAHWLLYALCYAEVAGAEPRVPSHFNGNLALVRAPAPTLQISEASSVTSVLFTDRDAPAHYNVWSVSFNQAGHVTAAAATTLADYVAHQRGGANPPEKIMPPGQEPPVKVLPPQQEPPVKTIPQ